MSRAAASVLRKAPRRLPLRGEAWLSGPRDANWWAARRPAAGAPGVGADGRVRALPQLDPNNLERDKFLEYMDNVWMLDDSLFAALDGEEAFIAPAWHGLRRPQVFYYGHQAAFYVNTLVRGGLVREEERVRPEFERLFEAGVDERPSDDMSVNLSPWPAVSEVCAYRKAVHALLTTVVKRELPASGSVATHSAHPLWALLMVVEHQRVHTETSSVLFREMPAHLIQDSHNLAPAHPSAERTGAAAEPRAGVDYRPARMLRNAGGRVQLGRRSEAEYGWDVEYGRRHVELAPFEAGACNVTNGELSAFVADGGYAAERHWSAEGWAWRESVGASAPAFWTAGGGLRLLLGEAPMQWDWPAVLNHHEASAYCAWLSEKEGLGAGHAHSYRPPAEAELALLRAQSAQEAGAGATDEGLGGEANTGLRWTSEAPVDALRPSRSGHHDLLGNLWQLCADEATPLEGYAPHHLYPEWSEPAFDGRHHMLVGGSFASGGAYSSPRARNYFRPHFFQHAGFRLARTL